MMFLFILCCVILNFEILEASLVITNAPMNVTVCSGTNGEISCGFTGVDDPITTIPNWSWRVIKRNNDGYVISNETVRVMNINNNRTDGLVFIIIGSNRNGITSANDSYLSVGPVDDTYNNTSYQCIFTINDTIIESDTAGIVTVIGALFPPLVMNTTIFNAISLWWPPVSSNMQCGEISYVVNRTPAHGTLTSINDTFYRITGLNYNTTYNITVFANSDIVGNGYPANITVKTISLQGTFKCNITSPKLMANTLEISCELLETLRRISATIKCTNCTCFQPIAIIGDSPIIVSNLIAGQYTIEMSIADSTEINDTIVEIISVSDNDKPINSTTVNSTIVDMITTSTSTVTTFVSPTNMPVNERSESLSTGAVAAITFVLTFIITLTATAIVTFVVMSVCIRKQYEKACNNQSSQDKVLYEQVCLPSDSIAKNDLELQPNPAYGTSHKVIMDTNPAYESWK